MISVQQAEELIWQNMIPFPQNKINLPFCRGRLLKEPIVAERHSPPFDRVCMDGVALTLAAWESGRRQFAIEGIQKAGGAQMALKNSEACLEVMTGAPLPAGCEGVIAYEDLTIEKNICKVKSYVNFQQGQNIQSVGSDHREGDLLVPLNTWLRSPHLGIAASSGKADLWVADSPSIAIVSTGDELVDFDQTPLPHQIRRSNPWALQAELQASHFHQTQLFHVEDREEEIFSVLGELLDKFPIIIVSGGVSKGRFDFIPKVLGDLQVRNVLHGVRQRPGKPFWFGVRGGGEEGKTIRNMVFGLPGNPCSSLVTLRRYVIPAFTLAQKYSPCLPKDFPGMGMEEESWAILDEGFNFPKPLTLFLPVKVKENKGGPRLVTLIPSNGSGDFASLEQSDGFIELQEGGNQFQPGQTFRFFPWRG